MKKDTYQSISLLWGWGKEEKPVGTGKQNKTNLKLVIRIYIRILIGVRSQKRMKPHL